MLFGWCNKKKAACITLIIQHMLLARRNAFRSDGKRKFKKTHKNKGSVYTALNTLRARTKKKRHDLNDVNCTPPESLCTSMELQTYIHILRLAPDKQHISDFSFFFVEYLFALHLEGEKRQRINKKKNPNSRHAQH